MAGLVPGLSRDCLSNSGVRGYSATGVVAVAGLVPAGTVRVTPVYGDTLPQGWWWWLV